MKNFPEIIITTFEDKNNETPLHMGKGVWLRIFFCCLKWMFWIILWIASRRGHFEIVKYLIENKADINAQNNKGNTALILGKSTKFR